VYVDNIVITRNGVLILVKRILKPSFSDQGSWKSKIFCFGGNIVSWKRKKQNVVA